jgi:hypothetical protein
VPDQTIYHQSPFTYTNSLVKIILDCYLRKQKSYRVVSCQGQQSIDLVFGMYSRADQSVNGLLGRRTVYKSSSAVL